MKYNYYFLKDFVNQKERQQINSLINEKGELFKEQATTVKTAVCHEIPYNLIHNIKDIKSAVNWINRQAFGVEVYSNIMTDNFIRNIYKSSNKGEYKWHFDAEPHDYNFTIKLTTLINLSENPYEGGEFFYWDGKPVAIPEYQEPGTLLTFPSFYLHQVTPVTKGERITGTFFMTGPKWK